MAHVQYIIGGQFLFDPQKNSLTSLNNQAESCLLGSNESRLLYYLILNATRTVSRKDLLEILRNERGIHVDNSSLTQSISRLRKALNDSYRVPLYIKTVPKWGYEFVANIDTESLSTECQEIEMQEEAPNNKDTAFGLLKPQLLLLNSLLLHFEVFVLLIIVSLCAYLLGL